MKAFLHLTFLIVLLNLFSCKEATSETKIEVPNKQIEVKTKDTISMDSVVKTKKPVIRKPREHYYVSARSGLNYREAPKGIVLGKFHLNTYLEVIEHTKAFEQIKDNGKTLKGEWLGVKKEMDTVYVFSGFLSKSFTHSEIQLFYASPPYYESKNNTSDGFVNLSQKYPFEYEMNTIIPEQELGKDPIKFNKIQTNKILKRTNISNKDTLYIFNHDEDSIYKHAIVDLTTIAYVNPYSKGDSNLKEHEYMIGLNLEKKYNAKGDNFAYIGKTNPFQTGKIKPMIWNKTDNTNFPIKEKIINDNTTLETYTLSLSNYKYFIQSHRFHKKRYNYIRRHHLVVIDTISETIVSEFNYNSSESISLSSIHTTDIEKEYHYSWTGELFKDKPPIIYGLYGNSFGCQSIDFIYKSEPPVPILCDNRH